MAEYKLDPPPSVTSGTTNDYLHAILNTMNELLVVMGGVVPAIDVPFYSGYNEDPTFNVILQDDTIVKKIVIFCSVEIDINISFDDEEETNQNEHLVAGVANEITTDNYLCVGERILTITNLPINSTIKIY